MSYAKKHNLTVNLILSGRDRVIQPRLGGQALFLKGLDFVAMQQSQANVVEAV